MGWVTIWKMKRDRAAWKAPTLERLASLSTTNDQFRREFETIKMEASPNEHYLWAQDQLIVMTNGEYLVYAFRHGFNNGSLDHLFLAHGSDGRWFYSSYHFCSHMAGVLGDAPPGSIDEFAKRYFAREFDGKSDICLERTWPVKN
jgi:hypothetical protein